MPRRSTGCEKCRQRKVKCDEARPHCQRCTNYGIPCPGYRPPLGQDLHFVDRTKRVAHQSGSEFALEHIPSGLEQGRHLGCFQWPAQLPEQPVTFNSGGQDTLGDTHRTSLLGTFLNMQSPIKRDQTTPTSFSYQTDYPLVNDSTSLLQVAIDELCNSEIRAMHDNGTQMESQSHYTDVPGLASSLTNQDTIQAAIMVLAMCKRLDTLLRDNRTRVQQLISGANFAQTTIDQEARESRSSWHWYQNIRHTSISMGLVKRRAVFLGGPKWLAITREASREDPYIDLLNVLAPLPGLLERADAITWSEHSLEDLATLCRELCWLRKDLEEWQYWRHVAPSGNNVAIVDSREMLVFTSQLHNSIYRTVYQFSSAEICSQYQLYWLAQTLLDFTLLDIIKNSRVSGLSPGLRLGNFTKRTEEDIQRESFVSANKYCRSIPFVCANGMTSIGPADLLLVTIARRFFEQAGHSRESEWCEAVHQILQSKCLTMPRSIISDILQFAASRENPYALEPSMHAIGPVATSITGFPHQEYFLGDPTFALNSTYPRVWNASDNYQLGIGLAQNPNHGDYMSQSQKFESHRRGNPGFPVVDQSQP